MKIGRGRLLVHKRVSIRISHDGQSTQVVFKGRPNHLALQRLRDDDTRWHAYADQEQWVHPARVVHLATKEELDAIGAEVKRVLSDPAEAARAAKSRASSKNSRTKQKLKDTMRRMKICLKDLIRAGVNTDEMEQELHELVKEALVEAIQET